MISQPPFSHKQPHGIIKNFHPSRSQSRPNRRRIERHTPPLGRPTILLSSLQNTVRQRSRSVDN